MKITLRYWTKPPRCGIMEKTKNNREDSEHEKTV